MVIFPSEHLAHNAMHPPGSVVSCFVWHVSQKSPNFKAMCSWYKSWYLRLHCATVSLSLSSRALAACNNCTRFDTVSSLGSDVLFSGTTSSPSSGYPCSSRPFIVHNMLENSLLNHSRILCLFAWGAALFVAWRNFCVYPLRAAPVYAVSISRTSRHRRGFVVSADWEPSRWQRWSDRRWRVSAGLDACIDWLFSGCSPKRGVVFATASSSLSVSCKGGPRLICLRKKRGRRRETFLPQGSESRRPKTLTSHDAAARISWPVPFVEHPTVVAFGTSPSFVLLILLFVVDGIHAPKMSFLTFFATWRLSTCFALRLTAWLAPLLIPASPPFQLTFAPRPNPFIPSMAVSDRTSRRTAGPLFLISFHSPLPAWVASLWNLTKPLPIMVSWRVLWRPYFRLRTSPIRLLSQPLALQ